MLNGVTIALNGVHVPVMVDVFCKSDFLPYMTQLKLLPFM